VLSIRIICRRPGFRRAGVAHAADQTWPDGFFTDGQIRLLKAERLLTVIELADEAKGIAETDLPSEPGKAEVQPQPEAQPEPKAEPEPEAAPKKPEKKSAADKA
jgi:outer membrane biosynthesis protein TonB